MNIDSVYQQTLLENSRRTDNLRQMDDATGIERGHNPSCGDDLTLLVKLHDGIVADVSFMGAGCAVSTASTNMLIDLIKGKTVEESRRLLDLFFKMMSKESLSDDNLDELFDAQMLGYFADMPARIKCATLSWHCAKVLLTEE